MKHFKIVLVCTIFISHLGLVAQLRADAGKDLIFCFTYKKGYSLSPYSDSMGLKDTLGGKPSAIGGKGPYTYRWTTLNDIVDAPQSEIAATSFLSSILVPNPKIIKCPYKRKPFFLTVTDSLGASARDTVYVSISDVNLDNKLFNKKAIDTAEISQIYWTSSMKNYYWEKKSFSSDTVGNPIKVWNTKNDSIKTWATDYYGCKSDTNLIFINIEYGIAIANSKMIDLILNFHNPITDQSVFDVKTMMGIERIELYNSNGQKMNEVVPSDKLFLGSLLKEVGYYFLTFYLKDGSSFYCKIKKE